MWGCIPIYWGTPVYGNEFLLPHFEYTSSLSTRGVEDQQETSKNTRNTQQAPLKLN